MICLFVRETGQDGQRPIGGASAWWLDKSLRSLTKDMRDLGGYLILRSGEPLDVLNAIIAETGAGMVVWNRRYSPADRACDARTKSALEDSGVDVKSFNGALLMEPWDVKTGAGTNYKVFTPFWKALRAAYDGAPAGDVSTIKGVETKSENLDDWSLHPSDPDWSSGLAAAWDVGESAARKTLGYFLRDGLQAYHDNRNRPDVSGTSRLSPHLHWGEVSPRYVWSHTLDYMERHSGHDEGGWTFLKELGWREFSHSLLYYADSLHEQNWNSDFDRFDWRSDDAGLRAWQKGQTGYPMVDAGMRQLWETGWMHNRVRMIVASFLVKHLRIDWREGERWFWDTLVDADDANNPGNWQWVAGSGADAAPYFRIFNPITQGEKFDPEGDYIRRWVPEIASLPQKFLYEPSNAPRHVLNDSGVTLGTSYPEPVVIHKQAREAALNAYKSLKEE